MNKSRINKTRNRWIASDVEKKHSRRFLKKVNIGDMLRMLEEMFDVTYTVTDSGIIVDRTQFFK